VPDRIELDLNADPLALRARPLGTSSFCMLGLILPAGAGLGLFIEVTALAGQNDVASSDPGVATGALKTKRFESSGAQVSVPHRGLAIWRRTSC
jgi:hypothetical protein